MNIQVRSKEKVRDFLTTIANAAQNLYQNAENFEYVLNQIDPNWQDEGSASGNFQKEARNEINDVKNMAGKLNDFYKYISELLDSYDVIEGRVIE